MRPRRGEGANRRGSQSIDRVRVLITDSQGALNVQESKELQTVSRQTGGGRLWARVVKWAWTWLELALHLHERHWFGPSAC